MLTNIETVRNWFSKESLVQLLGTPAYRVEELALEVLAGAGHRWRPYLCAGVYGSFPGRFADQFIRPAVSVECFHKASMIHDDIEDDDKPNALHRCVGVAQALNVGDFLIHQSYQLLLGFKAAFIEISNIGQRKLCLGQGEELHTQEKRFAALKTAPSFEVAFRLGAFYGHEQSSTIARFCAALGEAYQAKDDALDEGASRDVYLLQLSRVVGLSARFENPALSEFLSHYLITVFGEDTQCQSLHSSAAPANVPALEITQTDP